MKDSHFNLYILSFTFFHPQVDLHTSRITFYIIYIMYTKFITQFLFLDYLYLQIYKTKGVN